MELQTVRHMTALVTGASSGIGLELAKLLAANGHDVVLVARRTPRLQELGDDLMRRHDVNATIIPKDLSRPAAAEEIYSEVTQKQLAVDVLVNAAGFNVYGPFASTVLTSELAMIQVNVVALTSLTKLFLKDMVERRFGRILNVASTASFAPAPLDSVYCATKAHVRSFSEALSEELRGTGVTVTALCPGPTATEFAARAQMQDTNIFAGRLMSAAEVASIGYKAMMRGQAVTVAGMANKMLVFSMRLSLRAMTRKIAKRMLSRNTRSHASQVDSAV
jgi:uncharacterized protein